MEAVLLRLLKDFPMMNVQGDNIIKKRKDNALVWQQPCLMVLNCALLLKMQIS
jgi:hypothetical protein